MNPSTLRESSMSMALTDTITESPENSDSDSDSDATLEEELDRENWTFGAPLTRMVRLGNTDVGSGYTSGSFSSSSSDSEASTSSSIDLDIDFEALIDDLLALTPCPIPASGKMIAVDCTSSHVMVRALARNSHELLITLELNSRQIREDPWNPIPHIVCAVERGETVYLCFEVLREYDQPPFANVANYIDFFRQVLQGLTFLHEHRIVNLACSNPRSFMVYVGPSAPPSSEQAISSSSYDEYFYFDRAKYPVRYYHTRLSNVVRLPDSASGKAFQQDVEDCGHMLDGLLDEVPRIAPKLKSLVQAMTSGEFTADRSRQLFEALCKSLDPSVFYTPAATPAPSPGISRMSSMSKTE